MSIEQIQNGKAILGIEFGSTRIKSVLINSNHEVIASGSHEWENGYVDGIWTYSEEAILSGLQSSYADLKKDVFTRYQIKLTKIAGLGISAMMHGYLPFDSGMNLLVPFRTWRNTITGQAAEELTNLFSFNMPQRWSLSHLYQAILNDESHVKDITFLTTLAGWIHYLLTGEKVLGVGDASGMMPIDSDTCTYDASMVSAFDKLIADKKFPWKLADILPRVLVAGENAGYLTEKGAALLDPEGDLEPGCPLCPPEGDAGTGMAATNSVRARTGNVSAGTSIFSMIVLEKPMSKVYPEIDIVTTPAGKQVGMVHCNSCTSDINAWVSLFREFADLMGLKTDAGETFTKLFKKSLEADRDCGGLVNFNYLAGEPVTGLTEGRPMFLRLPDASMNLANFMRAQIYASMETLKYGMEIMNREKVAIDCVYGHGGLFKTEGVGQNYLAAAIHAPVTVMETAGEGGAWGIALLADYLVYKNADETLEDYLQNRVFAGMKQMTVAPDPADEEGFNRYMDRFVSCIPAQKEAAEHFRG
ncbi:FGGY-family carbohydrate kinase [Clostridiales bacterium FE2011]|nr:FGGY-family carbohydrate kinase [Clostridiales bacterium FE2011]QTE75186.1 FGGY-family carbohydrate kinase [Clostridiales bacterium FE2010]